MAKTGRQSFQQMLRLPDDMRDQLKAAADANNRSMNAEIIARLAESFESNARLVAAEHEVEKLHRDLAYQTGMKDSLREGLQVFISHVSKAEKGSHISMDAIMDEISKTPANRE
ncbi:Arc family DNA-binding protein [Aurantimonas sp. A2-1-M11]|uniref:Arc family DNA-binding protein n=1 Tax=Aurantimonas sp. A2-1-M11 TaxID=3113712 RepID=UPI002F932A1F